MNLEIHVNQIFIFLTYFKRACQNSENRAKLKYWKKGEVNFDLNLATKQNKYPMEKSIVGKNRVL